MICACGMKILLLLEDNAERVDGFRSAVRALGDDWHLHVWQDAPSMVSEYEEFLEQPALISLDHDLNPQPGVADDPGTGLDVARFLSAHPPICPVIIHSSNIERSWSMHNELRHAGWTVERVGPIGQDWIANAWLPKARKLLAPPQP